MFIGRIYKIIHNQSDLVYIGSTINTLEQRWSEHKSSFNQWLKGNGNCISIFPYFEKYGIEDFKIIMIKEYKCVDKKQLNIWETMWVNKLKCVNKYQPIDLFCGRCEHNRQKSQCKDCEGSGICEHDRIRTQCKDCGGGSICEHDRIRSSCKDCGGGSICEHDRIRSRCKECGGSQICEHNRRRSRCKECSPIFCQPCQKIYSKESYKRHCKSKKHLSSIEL